MPDYDTVCLKAASDNVWDILPDKKVTFSRITVRLILLAHVSGKEWYGVFGRGTSMMRGTLMMPLYCFGTSIRCETNFQRAFSSLIDWATPGPGITKDQKLYQHHSWFVKPSVELMLIDVTLKALPVGKLLRTHLNICCNLVGLRHRYEILSCHGCCNLLIDTAVTVRSTCVSIWPLQFH